MMRVVVTVCTVTGAWCWCLAGLLVVILAGGRVGAWIYRVRQQAEVVASAETLLRDTAGGGR